MYTYIYRERERCIYIYIYVYVFMWLCFRVPGLRLLIPHVASSRWILPLLYYTMIWGSINRDLETRIFA